MQSEAENITPEEIIRPQEIPLKMIEAMKEDDVVRKILESDSGTWEGYTIESHTLMVMTQFEKYFAGKPLPLDFNEDAFLKIVLVHDFGKARAVAEGDKNKQHEYNIQLCPEILKNQGLSEKEINIAKALLSSDALGQYIGSREQMNIHNAALRIKEMSETAGLTIHDFLELLIVYYQCDAGAYTEDATIEGIVKGEKSIDHLFIFDPENGQVRFSPMVEDKVNLLKERIKVLVPQ